MNFKDVYVKMII